MTGLLTRHAKHSKHVAREDAHRILRGAPVPAQERVAVDGLRFRRGDARFRVSGVTYGPFAPGEDGAAFPSAEMVRRDFAQMQHVGINAVRIYHMPPPWLLELAEERGICVLIDVPWSKHVCFLDSRQAQREARHAVRSAVAAGQAFVSILAYSIGNEIPASVVRWHGERRPERFLRELAEVS